MDIDESNMPVGLRVALQGARDLQEECTELGVLCEIICSVRERDEPGAIAGLSPDALIFFILSKERRRRLGDFLPPTRH